MDMKLVVGLGNPGSEYAGTRHNVGFEVLDALAERLGWCGKGEYNRLARSQFDGLTLDGRLTLSRGGEEKLLLLKPMTFMNVSGRSVQQAMSFFQLAPGDLMVVVDELALPVGRLRLRPSGSDGGHNGLKDIRRVLGTDQYPRLRVGIDSPPPFLPGRDYVLQRFTPEQRASIDKAVPRAAAAVVTWADLGMEAAMNQFNAAEDN
jgi:PTH1 family peptidyl-tRNA hydrolase